ncbi:hypothetical protein [Acaryochloris marina]|uniref:Uncharacterized protein n=1 Tax=Acaryochloris marina (strain MBIC 11017) TaxID=329726 RepID=A8ZL21_ACAM1|nr:hypothetical protein [Acaryochloris marina]ABW31489.1 hypothetical protein AM1_A0371 [Acaryochloris marina MBIC11017]BDM83534.1 hypothetical protein AM10699_63950 [Acaryochloris marina MBIC10699]
MKTAVTPVGNPVYWITFGPRINKPTETNITFPGTKLDLVESILHILSIHWDAWEYGRNAIQDFPNLEEAIFSEHVCYLLQKYYGATHQPNVDPETELDEIDLYDVWNWKHLFFSDEETYTDLADCLLNPELMAGINHRRYKPGLALEVHAMTLHGLDNYERYVNTPKGSLVANPSNGGCQMPVIEEVASGKVTKVPPNPNIFWINHKYCYLKSKLACVTTTKTYAQARLDAYYILSEALIHKPDANDALHHGSLVLACCGAGVIGLRRATFFWNVSRGNNGKEDAG